MQSDKLSGPYILTADIGGSHITVAVCDIKTKSIVPGSFARVEFSSKSTAHIILNTWENAFQQSIKSTGLPVTALAIAMPGPFDYEKGISYITGLNKYEALYGMDIKVYLANALNIDASLIKFRNDAEATITGEVLAGAGQGVKKVMGITLGTGFGSAFYHDNITTDLNLGSETFADSIADDHLSTRWFLRRYYDLSGVGVVGVKELASIARESQLARQVFKEFALNMSNFLKASLDELQPEVLIICGNIAKASALFLPKVKQQLNKTNIQIGQLGETAALIGAAGLFELKNPDISIDNRPINTL